MKWLQKEAAHPRVPSGPLPGEHPRSTRFQIWAPGKGSGRRRGDTIPRSRSEDSAGSRRITLLAFRKLRGHQEARVRRDARVRQCQSLSRVRLFVTPWSVHRVLQAGTLKWAAIPFPRRPSRPRDGTWALHCRQMLYHLSQQGGPQRGLRCTITLTDEVQQRCLPFSGGVTDTKIRD